ncbi:MAG TPA: hemerythrin domain-containing protein, partial [Bryobacteraceae bacterium]|nr:hemerythrin domain-containing protein [Bryobacteraceae bacterium]
MNERSSGRDLAMVVSGIAVGLIGSRLLPPIMAMATGAMRGTSTGDPFQKLENDHRVLLKTLGLMERDQTDNIAKRTAMFLAVKRKLAKHALAEEDVVYPLLQDEAQRREAAKHLYEEHAEMKVLLFEIETCLMERRPWTQHVSRLRAMIERH